MTNIPSVPALEARKAEIKRQKAELDAELEEIETAEKVIQRYGIAQPPHEAKANGTKPNTKAPKTMTGKIFQIVGEGQVKEPADVLNAIRERWLPDVDGNDVRPTLWRLVKEGRIIKGDNGYRLPDS